MKTEVDWKKMNWSKLKRSRNNEMYWKVICMNISITIWSNDWVCPELVGSQKLYTEHRTKCSVNFVSKIVFNQRCHGPHIFINNISLTCRHSAMNYAGLCLGHEFVLRHRFDIQTLCIIEMQYGASVIHEWFESWFLFVLVTAEPVCDVVAQAPIRFWRLSFCGLVNIETAANFN